MMFTTIFFFIFIQHAVARPTTLSPMVSSSLSKENSSKEPAMNETEATGIPDISTTMIPNNKTKTMTKAIDDLSDLSLTNQILTTVSPDDYSAIIMQIQKQISASPGNITFINPGSNMDRKASPDHSTSTISINQTKNDASSDSPLVVNPRNNTDTEAMLHGPTITTSKKDKGSLEDYTIVTLMNQKANYSELLNNSAVIVTPDKQTNTSPLPNDSGVNLLMNKTETLTLPGVPSTIEPKDDVETTASPGNDAVTTTMVTSASPVIIPMDQSEVTASPDSISLFAQHDNASTTAMPGSSTIAMLKNDVKTTTSSAISVTTIPKRKMETSLSPSHFAVTDPNNQTDTSESSGSSVTVIPENDTKTKTPLYDIGIVIQKNIKTETTSSPVESAPISQMNHMQTTAQLSTSAIIASENYAESTASPGNSAITNPKTKPGTTTELTDSVPVIFHNNQVKSTASPQRSRIVTQKSQTDSSTSPDYSIFHFQMNPVRMVDSPRNLTRDTPKKSAEATVPSDPQILKDGRVTSASLETGVVPTTPPPNADPPMVEKSTSNSGHINATVLLTVLCVAMGNIFSS